MSGPPAASSLRAIGVDLGTKRIGVALSDRDGAMATPYEVIERSGDEARDHACIVALAVEADAATIVVGMPVSLDGSVGPAAAAVAAEVERLGNVAPVPVETFDERLTTVSAERDLAGAGVRGRARRRIVDAVAASVMLGAWLDHQRSAQRDL